MSFRCETDLMQEFNFFLDYIFTFGLFRWNSSRVLRTLTNKKQQQQQCAAQKRWPMCAREKEIMCIALCFLNSLWLLLFKSNHIDASYIGVFQWILFFYAYCNDCKSFIYWIGICQSFATLYCNGILLLWRIKCTSPNQKEKVLVAKWDEKTMGNSYSICKTKASLSHFFYWYA